MACWGLIISELTGPKILKFDRPLVIGEDCIIANFFIFLKFGQLLYTVLLISTARFSVHILLLHHYKSDLAHISDKYISVIELYLSEIRAKQIKKRTIRSICTKFAHFWVVLVRKCMVKRFVISYRFVFCYNFFCGFLIIPYELFYIISSRRAL